MESDIALLHVAVPHTLPLLIHQHEKGKEFEVNSIVVVFNLWLLNEHHKFILLLFHRVPVPDLSRLHHFKK